jgi:hypothetical protein
MKTTSYSHIGLSISLFIYSRAGIFKKALVLLSSVMQLTTGIKM